MSETQRKEEKDEKEEKKHEKEEKGRSDPLSAAVWGAIFVWAGLVLLAANMNLLPGARFEDARFPWMFLARMETWSLIFVGAGVIVLAEVVIRLLVPAYRRAVTGTLIFAIILLGIGLGGTIGWSAIGPLIIIVIGVSILVRGFGRRL
jgi:hypothetical protein